MWPLYCLPPPYQRLESFSKINPSPPYVRLVYEKARAHKKLKFKFKLKRKRIFIGCQIAITGGLPEPQPLLIIPGTDEFFDPQSTNGIVYLTPGEQIELYCSGSFVLPFTGNRSLYAYCGAAGQFIVNGKDFSFDQLACTGQVFHTARRTEHSCGIQGHETHIEVGFDLGGNRFLHLMDICHDEVLESSLYTHHIQTPANIGFQRSFPRPSFLTGDFFNGKNVDRLYTKVQQMETIGRVLGEERLPELFDDTRDIYLARGHLAAKADYIYGSQQRGTFYFVNVAPQWQRFNGGNWENVESGVRAFIASRNIFAELYTGTWGVLELKDVHGDYQEIYLYYDENGKGQIPVPALYYKVVRDVDTNLGIVLIGVNNPHATQEEIVDRYTICEDVSDLIDWIGWSKTDILRGYSYACDVNDFVRTVTHLPANVRTSGLLY